MGINPGLLPNDGAPISGPGGLATQEWRDFFLLLAMGAESDDLRDEYLALAERVSVLEEAGSKPIYGGNGISVVTTPDSITATLTASLPNLLDVDNDLDVMAADQDALVYDLATEMWGPKAVLLNPMTTLGDVIVGDTGGAPIRLGIGATDQVLGELAGVPAYVDRVIEVQAGTNVTVDTTDPMRPIINATGGASFSEGAIGATFDGGGAALTPGVFTDVFVPFNCTIVGATLLADTTGNLVVSVLADPYASFPPTTDLAPTTPPTISGSDKSQDTTLSGWSTAIAAGDVVRLGVVSCSSITRATLSLEVTKP